MSKSSRSSCLSCGGRLSPEDKVCGSCGAKNVAPDEPAEAWIGRVIDGKYEIDRVLGVGGMGMVFAARRTLVGDEVALKVLYPRLLESRLQRDLFRDEAIASARLSHRNVVTVFDTGFSEETGAAYIAMELLRGKTLKVLLREQAPAAPSILVPIAIQVCKGLSAAHRAQIIHRDLKPDNIFLEEIAGGEYRVKLVDFGISAMLDVDRSGERRQRLGTLRYMSPEQCRGRSVDARADLYALGVVLYEGLTRRRVTGKSVTAVCNEVPQIPNVLLPTDGQLPRALEDLLMRMLAKEPDERPDSAMAVSEALRLTLNAEAPSLEAPPKRRRLSPASSQPSSWLGWRFAVGVGVIVGTLWGLLR